MKAIELMGDMAATITVLRELITNMEEMQLGLIGEGDGNVKEICGKAIKELESASDAIKKFLEKLISGSGEINSAVDNPKTIVIDPAAINDKPASDTHRFGYE